MVASVGKRDISIYEKNQNSSPISGDRVKRKIHDSHISSEDEEMILSICEKSTVAFAIREDTRHWPDLAGEIKSELESTKKGAWHVIVGVNFGAFVTFEAHNMIHFSLGDISFLVYKHG